MRAVMSAAVSPLLSQGSEGFLRWSFRPEWKPASILSDAKKLLISAEESPAGSTVQGAVAPFAQSTDRKVLVAIQNDDVVVLADQPDRPVHLGSHRGVRHVAVSPLERPGDPRHWVATGGLGGAKVWDVRTGTHVDLPVGSFCRVVFSPDGNRLLTGDNGEIRVWEVGTWAEVPVRVPMRGAAFAFSPDGKVLAVETGAGVACLVNPQTGEEYARLEDPNRHSSDHFTFSPDRTKLVCASGNGYCLHVWDLQALRRQLTVMGLNWQD
jgi:WD40 repeat protein